MGCFGAQRSALYDRVRKHQRYCPVSKKPPTLWRPGSATRIGIVSTRGTGPPAWVSGVRRDRDAILPKRQLRLVGGTSDPQEAEPVDMHQPFLRRLRRFRPGDPRSTASIAIVAGIQFRRRGSPQYAGYQAMANAIDLTLFTKKR